MRAPRPALLDRGFPYMTNLVKSEMLDGQGMLEEVHMQMQCFNHPVFDINNYPHYCFGAGCPAWRWVRPRAGWRRILHWLLFKRRGRCGHSIISGGT